MGGGVDRFATDPLFDVDGCAEQLFLYLWTKNRSGSSCPGVRVPDTVRRLLPRSSPSPPIPAPPPQPPPRALRCPRAPLPARERSRCSCQRWPFGRRVGSVPGPRAPMASRGESGPCGAALTRRPGGVVRRW